jgi:hypothetical protein
MMRDAHRLGRLVLRRGGCWSCGCADADDARAAGASSRSTAAASATPECVLGMGRARRWSGRVRAAVGRRFRG